MSFNIGDRVRCTNTSQYRGRSGIVVGYDDYYIHYSVIHWDGDAGVGGGGCWSDNALELLPNEDEMTREEVLENAVEFALAIFEEYADQHMQKGSLFKAMSNIGFAAVMDDALRTD